MTARRKTSIPAENSITDQNWLTGSLTVSAREGVLAAFVEPAAFAVLLLLGVFVFCEVCFVLFLCPPDFDFGAAFFFLSANFFVSFLYVNPDSGKKHRMIRILLILFCSVLYSIVTAFRAFTENH